MRIGLMLAAMLVPIGSAAADNPRYLPAVGTTATFRLLVTTDFGRQRANRWANLPRGDNGKRRDDRGGDADTAGDGLALSCRRHVDHLQAGTISAQCQSRRRSADGSATGRYFRRTRQGRQNDPAGSSACDAGVSAAWPARPGRDRAATHRVAAARDPDHCAGLRRGGAPAFLSIRVRRQGYGCLQDDRRGIPKPSGGRQGCQEYPRRDL